MIIGSDRALVIGQRYSALTKDLSHQPFVVLRAATFEEWRAERAEDGTELSAYHYQLATSLCVHYYDVSVD